MLKPCKLRRFEFKCEFVCAASARQKWLVLVVQLSLVCQAYGTREVAKDMAGAGVVRFGGFEEVSRYGEEKIHFAWQVRDFVCLASPFVWQAQYFRHTNIMSYDF